MTHRKPEAVLALLAQSEARALIARNAENDARERFDANRQTESYLAWYRTIIDDWNLDAASAREESPARASGEVRMAEHV